MGTRTLALVVTLCGGCGDSVGDSASDGAIGCPDGAGWGAAPPMLDGPTQETAVVELGGRIYSLGGFDDAFAVLDSVQVFDTATCTWSAGPRLPRPLHHINAAVLGGRVYIAGALLDLQFAAVG